MDSVEQNTVTFTTNRRTVLPIRPYFRPHFLDRAHTESIEIDRNCDIIHVELPPFSENESRADTTARDRGGVAKASNTSDTVRD